MEFILDYILFLAKSITIVVAVVMVLLVLVNVRTNLVAQKESGRIEFDDLGKRLSDIKEQFDEILAEEREERRTKKFWRFWDRSDRKKNTKKENKNDDDKKESQVTDDAEVKINDGEKESKVTDDAEVKISDGEKESKVTDDAEVKISDGEKESKVINNVEAKISDDEEKNTLYVVDFDGDIDADEVKNLREEISAIIQIAEENDEVLVRLKSPGGAVNGYGLAASQLARLRDKGIHLTVAVDEVAASGGYLMACVANHIIAAPFSIVGSIGVVAQLPNFHRLLEKHNIDFEQFTAGQYKRTVTMFGENTDEARQKFTSELEEIHRVFKEFVQKFRPSIDIEAIATGEYWLAIKAYEMGLVDEIQTSDSYYQEKLTTMNVYSVEYKEKKSIRQGLIRLATKIFNRVSL